MQLIVRRNSPLYHLATRAPRWFGFHMEQCRVQQDTTTFFKIGWF